MTKKHPKTSSNDLENATKDKGIITQAEFEAKKKQILGEKQPIATLRSLPQEEGERMKVLEQIQAPEKKKKKNTKVGTDWVWQFNSTHYHNLCDWYSHRL